MSIDARNYHAEERLKDGSKLSIRAIRPEDKHMLQEEFKRLSPRSVYFRFFTHRDEFTEEELKYFTEVDFVRHVAIGASYNLGEGEIPVGVGRYIVPKTEAVPTSAEFAIVVADAYRGLGIGTCLFKHLVKIASSNGLSSLTALVLSENLKMLQLIYNSGLPVIQTTNSAGVIEIRLDLGTADLKTTDSKTT
jgi:GNAT superfamily N-acetyltransferase